MAGAEVDPWMNGVTGRQYIDHVLSGDGLVEAAAAPHDNGWYPARTQELIDPNNPFQGYGEKRTRVRDLTDDELTARGIPLNADPSATVLNPAYRPFSELPEDDQSKNVVPVAVTLLSIGDRLLHADSTLQDLIGVSEVVRDGTDAAVMETVGIDQHIGYLASAARAGERPGETGNPDFLTYAGLTRERQQIDADAAQPVAEWLHDRLSNRDRLAFESGIIAGNHLLANINDPEVRGHFLETLYAVDPFAIADLQGTNATVAAPEPDIIDTDSTDGYIVTKYGTFTSYEDEWKTWWRNERWRES